MLLPAALAKAQGYLMSEDKLHDLVSELASARAITECSACLHRTGRSGLVNILTIATLAKPGLRFASSYMGGQERGVAA